MFKSASPDIRVHVNAKASTDVPTAISLTISHVHVSYLAHLPMTPDEVKERLVTDLHQLICSVDMTDRFRLECLWPDTALRTSADGLTVIPRNVVHLDQRHRQQRLDNLHIITELNNHVRGLIDTVAHDDSLLRHLDIDVHVVVDQELSLMLRVYYAMVEQNILSERRNTASSVMAAITILTALISALYGAASKNVTVALLTPLATIVCAMVCFGAYAFHLAHRRIKADRRLQEALDELDKLNSQSTERRV